MDEFMFWLQVVAPVLFHFVTISQELLLFENRKRRHYELETQRDLYQVRCSLLINSICARI